MVVALVHYRLDYGNGVLVDLPAYLMRQLQSVLNAAARRIFRLKSSDQPVKAGAHKRICNIITDALISLHWLRVPEQIHYKLAVIAYKVLHGRALSYTGHLSASPMCLVVEDSAPPAQIASWCRQSRPPPSAVEPSQSLPH